MGDRRDMPLVEKVHREVRKFVALGYWILLVGHRDHDEIVGTSGEAPAYEFGLWRNVDEARNVAVPDPEKVVVLTQTTLSVDDTREMIQVLKERFPQARHAGQRRYLLRNAEPPGRREAAQ